MKLAEYLEDLDPKLAGNLERAMDAVRQEFEDKLTATVEQTVAAAAEEAAALASEAPKLPPVASEPAALALDAADELRLAALDIDIATSQSEILEALSRGVLRFASRVAIFVNRGQEVHGWSASGFGEADSGIKEVSLGGDIPFPMADRLSSGSVALSSDDCALVCDALNVGHPSMGLLLPFVLGNQVVGTVYCDRVEEEVFSVSALQLLTYVAGQTLETLPVRKRESTATLLLADGGVEQTEAARADSVPPSTPTAEVDEEIEAPAEPEIEPAVEEFETEPEVATEDNMEEAGTAVDLSVPTVDVPADLPPPSYEPQAEVPSPLDEASAHPGSLIPEAPPSAEPSAPPTIEEALDEQPTGAMDEPAPEPVEPTAALGSNQVEPPDDLKGPGWAFTTSGEPGEPDSDSEHEEAQRLARLLVTEIKLYNEEAVEEGRSNANVYSRLQEDIDRSRQIYEDRIDPALRNENDYFKQALVRILAGGDPSLLGI
jgi:hypothetical protein